MAKPYWETTVEPCLDIRTQASLNSDQGQEFTSAVVLPSAIPLTHTAPTECTHWHTALTYMHTYILKPALLYVLQAPGTQQCPVYTLNIEWLDWNGRRQVPTPSCVCLYKASTLYEILWIQLFSMYLFCIKELYESQDMYVIFFCTLLTKMKTINFLILR